ncbi:hypothetical protein [Gemmobacter serpentinus]|uniref:hypothetical protein n=1 Tax=Gemmobacter serpentinus TaxID=2652247 RepID=UPI00186578A9|nr:hypothetical protein [Gemmobacter serpentinus]
MTFVTRLLAKFRKTAAVEPLSEDDIFALRLSKMQGRARLAQQGSPFKNHRTQPAA